jgi:hypothetical protein
MTHHALTPPALTPVTLDYPDLAENAGLIVARTTDGLQIELAREPLRTSIRVSLPVVGGASAISATVIAVTLGFFNDQGFTPAVFTGSMVLIFPMLFGSGAFISVLHVLWRTRRRVMIALDGHHLVMEERGLLPLFRMKWPRSNITRLHVTTDGIWVYVDGRRDGRIVCLARAQEDWVARFLSRELGLPD